MSEIKLFKIGNNITELVSRSVNLEKELQTIIENNMQTFFGVSFLKSEYRIKEGRMDSIGIDEDFSPVIFEYKRKTNDNVINQGLFYLNWLLEHKADFKLLVMEQMGNDIANKIDWTMPRVICIASDFNKFDEQAIKQINRKITLIRYKKYNDDLLLFELLNTNEVDPLPLNTNEENAEEKKNSSNSDKTFKEQLDSAPEKIVKIYEELRDYTLELGDDISQSVLKLYTAFKKIKNFFTIEVYQSRLILHFKLNPDDYNLDENLRDVRNKGHWGTGDLECVISDDSYLNKIKELISDAYINN